MRSSYRPASATAILVALVVFAGIHSSNAQAQNSQPRYAHRAAGQRWQGERRETAPRQGRRVLAVRPTPGMRYRQGMAARSFNQRRLANGDGLREGHFAAGGRSPYVSRVLAGGQVRVVRYGNGTNGTFERTVRPGLVTRTFVAGGHVLYAHAYQHQVWHQFGRAFTYERFVPSVRYPHAYYAWALAAWAHPVRYSWGWQAQPWYPAYGALFTPYAVYTSPDLWMTDYIISQSLQTAYQAQGAAPEAQSATPVQGATQPEVAPAEPVTQPDDATPDAQATPAPAPEPQSEPQSAQPIELPVAPLAPPPAITPQIKAQLDTEIKVQLQEQQDAAAKPASLTASAAPPALKPNHVFFQVVQPLNVPSGQGDHYCSLSPDDYIRRTGGMSNDDWTIPVVVELSGSSDCPAGLQTRIGLNDLNAMENEQEAQVMEAMQAASKSMGTKGPPSGPGVHPTLIAAGSAAPDPSALEAIRETQ